VARSTHVARHDEQLAAATATSLEARVNMAAATTMDSLIVSSFSEEAEEIVGWGRGTLRDKTRWRVALAFEPDA
jgi:hypothetical protein